MQKLLQFRLSNQLSIGLSYMIGRWILGISFFNAAIWKIFTLSPVGHAQKFFIGSFQGTWIPTFLLWTLGWTIPYFELFIGILLCLGLRAREVALLSGLLLIVTTYGHSLLDPLYNISQGLTFSRIVLTLFLLIVPDNKDKISLDYLISRIHR
jgi:uncharacterized membrane protein YphA (DoxX/SURF4 family)